MGRRDEFFLGRVISLADESIVSISLELEKVSFFRRDTERIVNTAFLSPMRVANMRDDQQFRSGPLLRDAAVMRGEELTVFAIAWFDTLYITQRPGALLKLRGQTWVRVSTPPGAVVSCVTVAPDGELLAVGNVAGEVLTKRLRSDWMTEEVFTNEGISALFVRDGTLVAVSECGAVAARDGEWEIVQQGGVEAVQQPAILPSGDLVLLYANGRLEKASREDRAPIDYLALVPEADRGAFSLRGFFVWGGGPCVWGVTDAESLVLHTESGRVWRLPIPKRSVYASPFAGLFQGQRLVPRAVGPVFAWSDRAFVYHDGDNMLVAGLDGCRRAWGPYSMSSASDELPPSAGDGDLQTVRRLLDRGADLNVADAFGMTALHHACGEGHMDVVRLLLARHVLVGLRILWAHGIALRG